MIPGTVRGKQATANVVDRTLLVRYRVMAFTTAALLIILVFVGIPLQFAAGRPEVANLVGTMHGVLYLVYLYVAFALTRRLGIPKWKMALVLLAGTVPFCAFIAERKMTKRFETVAQAAEPTAGLGARRSLRDYASSVRTRWLSPRALVLHLGVVVVALACLGAGWWQATRALAGNQLSWVYSVEWPVFALVAVAGWWQLIHEDPEAYRARKLGPPAGEQAVTVETSARQTSTFGPEERASVGDDTARLATMLAVLLGVEFVLGIVVLLSLPFGRPSGWLPARGEAIYLAHAILGLLLSLGAVALVVRIKGAARTDQIVAWMGLIGVALAGVGGLLTEAQSIMRFLGMTLMFVGPAIAILGYLAPMLIKMQHEPSPVGGG